MDSADDGQHTLTKWSQQPQGNDSGEHDGLLAFVIVVGLLVAVGFVSWKLVGPLLS